MIIKENIIRGIIKESGIRNINKLRELFDEVIIVTHQDLDGVTSAIGMKYYFERYGFDVIDTKIIQYGESEWSLKVSKTGNRTMYCLCDFAHGKPMFTVHLDHHDSQIGVEKDTATSFRHARSNIETISQILSPSDIFPSSDITMISTVDSADFVKQNITPDDIMRYVFTLNKERNFTENKKIMALVTNKLLLAYKNKPQFLETLVMESTPSLVNIYLNIVRLAKENNYATPEMMKANLEDYIEVQKNSDTVKYLSNYGIIVQYGGGSMFKPGSYDRYVPFKNHPDANFLVILWPLGLMQSSCNPFKKDRSLKGVNLGEVAQEMLKTFETELMEKKITFNTIKYFSEKHKSFGPESVGYKYTDMVAMFDEDTIEGLNTLPNGASEGYTVDRWKTAIRNIMNKPYTTLSEKEKKALSLISISGWDMIQANSGGHKCITNISGLMYFGKDGTDFLKRFAKEFIRILKIKIDDDK